MLTDESATPTKPRPSLARRILVGDPSKASLSKAGQSLALAVYVVLVAAACFLPGALHHGGWSWAVLGAYLALAPACVWRASRLRRTQRTRDSA